MVVTYAAVKRDKLMQDCDVTYAGARLFSKPDASAAAACSVARLLHQGGGGFLSMPNRLFCRWLCARRRFLGQRCWPGLGSLRGHDVLPVCAAIWNRYPQASWME